jgi:hypothetical protein
MSVIHGRPRRPDNRTVSLDEHLIARLRAVNDVRRNLAKSSVSAAAFHIKWPSCRGNVFHGRVVGVPGGERPSNAMLCKNYGDDAKIASNAHIFRKYQVL